MPIKEPKQKQNDMPILESIKDVEIFAIGTWNEDDYTESDLDILAEAYNETRDLYQPHLKIGHNKDQSILKADDIPAAGYMKNVRRVGSKLIADFFDIPQKVYQLMERKAYKQRSCEIYWDFNFNGKIYKRFLKGCALLGAEMPGVHTLADIINFYGLDTEKINEKKKPNVILKVCNFESNEKSNITERQMNEKTKELETANETLSSEKAALEKTYKSEKEAKETAEKKYSDAQEEIAKFKADKEKDNIKMYVQELETEKLVTPAMKPLIVALIGPTEKEYSVNTSKKKGEVVEKKYESKQAILKETLKLLAEASTVNLDENSEDVTPETGDKDALLEAKVQKYMTEHKVEYRDAAAAVINEQAKV